MTGGLLTHAEREQKAEEGEVGTGTGAEGCGDTPSEEIAIERSMQAGEDDGEDF